MPIRDLLELWEIAKAGDSDGLRKALSDEGRPYDIVECNEALKFAAENGHAECVSVLIPHSNPRLQESLPLQIAAGYGFLDCLRLLMPVSDPKADNFFALKWATDNGHAGCVKELLGVPLTRKDRKNINEALGKAAIGGHIACVEALIPFADADHDSGFPLWAAVLNGYYDIARVLLPHTGKQDAATEQQRKAQHPEAAARLESLIQAESLMQSRATVEKKTHDRRGV